MSIASKIIAAAVSATENDVYSVGDIAAAMLHVMWREDDWTTEFVREVMITVIFVVSTDDNNEYAEYAAIIVEAARAIMAGAARAEDEQGWVDVDDIEVVF
jgi:pyridoxal/pyridoxine/pyridoxamine kinase